MLNTTLRRLGTMYHPLRRAVTKFLRPGHFSSHSMMHSPLSAHLRHAATTIGAYSSGRRHHHDFALSYGVYAQAAVAALFLGLHSDPVFAEEGDPIEPRSNSDVQNADELMQRIDDGSVVSNVHTTKWRVFTDRGRDSFLKGELDEAERFFLSALHEAKQGFGEKDAHVASSCNNLAELYRLMKRFDVAEPLYLESINILEESYGLEDVRVGAALHNLGKFYLIQRKLEEARTCYERALKIKGRVLGYAHPDYADTMYHLGTVLNLLGKEESEALFVDSIKILEEGGLGGSSLSIKRLRHLAQVYLRSARFADAENVQRKILHIYEISKGWDQLDTIIAAEGLALTLKSADNLRESHELLQRCLDARKRLLPKDHIQIAGNMLHLARVAMLLLNKLQKENMLDAMVHLNEAKESLDKSIRIARLVLGKLGRQRSIFSKEESTSSPMHMRTAMVILMQSLDALASLETRRQELQDSKDNPPTVEAENALVRCISVYKEFRKSFVTQNTEVKVEYVSCLKHLYKLVEESRTKHADCGRVTVEELKDEIRRIESEIGATDSTRK